MMHNPPHPGEFIEAVFLAPTGMSCRGLAKHLDVSASTVSRMIKGQSAITPDMALRLAKVLGRSAESWLLMQDQYALWQARKMSNLNHLQSIHSASVTL